MKRTFKRHLQALEDIFRFVDEFISAHQLGSANSFSVSFVVEELFTNMVKYNSASAGEINIELEKQGREIVITVVDHSETPFDLTKKESVDTNEPLSNRKPGGLGIHLVKKIADRIDYQYDRGISTITVVKHIES